MKSHPLILNGQFILSVYWAIYGSFMSLELQQEV